MESPTGQATHQTGLDPDAADRTEDARREAPLPAGAREDEAAPATVRGEDQPGEPTDGGPEVEVIERDSSTRTLFAEILPEVVLLIVAGYLFYLAGDFKGQAEPGQLGPAFWPRMAAAGMAIALLVSIFQTVRARRRPLVKVRSDFEDETPEAEIDYTQAAIAMALAVGYVFATMFLGYLIATAVFLTAFIWLGGQRRWYVPLIGVAGSLASTSIFIGIVFVALPTGVGVFDTVTVAIYRLLGLQ